MILSKLSRFVLKNNQNVRQLTTKYKKTLEKHPVLVQAVQVSGKETMSFRIMNENVHEIIG